MSRILQSLSGGDLRSDGMANQVADTVLRQPELFDDLLAGLSDSDDVIRGRAADALEKVARARPDLLVDRFEEWIAIIEGDKLPMVRWHGAMTLGHLAGHEDMAGEIASNLLRLLEDDSVFVRSWSIVSLCILGRRYPGLKERIAPRLERLQSDSSVAIRSRARKAADLLTNEAVPFPKGWIKSPHLADL